MLPSLGHSAHCGVGGGDGLHTLESQASFSRDQSGTRQGNVRDVLGPGPGQREQPVFLVTEDKRGAVGGGGGRRGKVCRTDHQQTWAIAPAHRAVAQELNFVVITMRLARSPPESITLRVYNCCPNINETHSP